MQGLSAADFILQDLVLQGEVPGLAVTILRKGKTLMQKGYGLSSIEQNTPVDSIGTLFRVASISKCITALAFGKMVEDGVLHWDDSFYQHVPYYPKKSNDFTLRQLASHTAGIRGYRGKEYALNQSYSIRESLAVFRDDALVFEPGKGYLYNSYDFVLLALAMQEASKIPFETYVKQNILLPLGMKATLFPGELSMGLNTPGEIQMAEFYTKNRKGFRKAVTVNNFYKLAGGGYLATCGDIAEMGQAILDGALLKKETYDELLRAQTINGGSTCYGLGFQVSQDAHGRSFWGHIGSSVGAYTNFFVYPKEQLVISVLMNCTDPKVQHHLDKAIETLFIPNADKGLP